MRSLQANSFGWALALAGAVMVGAAPAARAQSQGDIGKQMEREYGVVERDYAEGRRLNNQLDRIVERIVGGVNAKRKSGDQFELKSAMILGGKSDKHDRMINAFALPDGRIYVTLGLVRAVQDSSRADDELSFVVGHEVTHVTDEHGKGQQKKGLTAGIAAILLGAVTKSKTIDTIAGAGASAYVSHYSRKDEYSADRGGLMAMKRAGYDLDSAVAMLERLKSAGEEQNRLVNGWFGSHPLTANRIERIREMIADIRAGRKPGEKSEKELERDDRRRR